MRSIITAVALSALLLTFASPGMANPPTVADSPAPPIRMLVFLEAGSGNAARAQPHVKSFVDRAAKLCGWTAAEGIYTTRKKRALSYIAAEKPAFGIISLPAFLSLSSTHEMDVVGQVEARTIGGTQYALVSKTAKTLGGCKGKPLASNHFANPTFIERVLFDAKTKLTEFELVSKRRPIQPLKAVIRDEAVCALVDDAQLTAIAQLEGGDALQTIWSSEILPGVPVVAFRGFAGDHAKTFRDNLGKMCGEEGRSTCTAVGIEQFQAYKGSAYASLLARFKQP